jgi:beta-mannosidase
MRSDDTRIYLDGDWFLYYFPEGEYVFDHPDQLLNSDLTPIPAQVPGNVELDLHRAGVIPDPFFGMTFQDLRVFEVYEWWYVREFQLDEDHIGKRYQLVLSGLDTFGEVWINGVKIGATDNMLIEHRFLLEDFYAGTNQIAIRIQSAVNQARLHQYEPSMMSWENREEGLFIRKAPHMWGWDIMPRIVSAGIWRSVWLEICPEIGFDQIYYWTAAVSGQEATLGVWFQFHTQDVDLSGYEIDIQGICGEHEFQYTWPVSFITGRCKIQIRDPRLWWPRGYGLPNIYTLAVRLKRQGETLAERVDKIGLRTIDIKRTGLAGPSWKPETVNHSPQLVDQAFSPDGCFVVEVNKVPIMIKGTNWVPLDAYHSRDNSRLDQAFEMVDDLGCNMIRCWGGNVYEDHHFFDLCDQNGVLVWQDFAFACCRYPQSQDYLARVRHEAEIILVKLRNHPSLVIWCGDNEIDMTYLADGLSPGENRISREVLPQILHRLDPYRAYIPSSPYSPPALVQGADPGVATAEQHLWGPRGYYKSPYYTDHNAHFIGEIGYHGCPHVASINKFISPDKVWPWQDNPEWQAHAVYHWKHHAIDRDRIQLMANQILELFGEIPDSLPEFVVASQICQAEAKKFFIESTRVRKWRTSGILWWNLLDGWPQFSDAVVDYYFAKKLAYHYIQRVQQPVCVFLGEPGNGKYLPVIASNDCLQSHEIAYRIWDGGTGATASQGNCNLPPNQNWQVDRIRTFSSENRMYLIQWSVGGVEYGNHYLVGLPPISLVQYRLWLSMIARLPRPFDDSPWR